MKIKALLTTILAAAAISVCLGGCATTESPSTGGNTNQNTNQQTEQKTDEKTDGKTEQQQQTEQQKTESKTEYNVGETWIVEGQWALTVTGVTATDDRNPFSEKAPVAVYIVDYTYTNLGYTDTLGLMDGLYFNINDTVIDCTNKTGYSYPLSVIDPQEAPVGATCDAQVCIGVDNAGDFKLYVTEYDGNYNKQKVTFNATVGSQVDASETHAKFNVDISAEKSITYNIGETWTVDGQWTLTVTGVTLTEDRNQFSDKSPAAVYIVDYTYTNIGYEDSLGIMDGIYFTLDDIIVDSIGKMGDSYPLTVTKSAQEAPVGATSDGQVCICVNNPGSFKLYVTKYDGNDEKQKAIFNVTVG